MEGVVRAEEESLLPTKHKHSSFGGREGEKHSFHESKRNPLIQVQLTVVQTESETFPVTLQDILKG